MILISRPIVRTKRFSTQLSEPWLLQRFIVCLSCVCRVFVCTWDAELFHVALTQSFVLAMTGRIYRHQTALYNATAQCYTMLHMALHNANHGTTQCHNTALHNATTKRYTMLQHNATQCSNIALHMLQYSAI